MKVSFLQSPSPSLKTFPHSRTVTNKNSPRTAFMLIDCMVYIGVLLILLGVAYAALYRCTENSVRLRRSTEDVAAALNAGERWRADVRAVNGTIRSVSTEEGTMLVLPCPRGEVAYLFSSNSVSRRIGGSGWSCLLSSVTASAMESDHHTNFTGWRWELELKPRSKRPVSVRPLFTFLAVPNGGTDK